MTHLGPYELNKVHLGDCIELMKELPDKCVDCVVTDPPYGLGNLFGRQQLKNGRQFANDGEQDYDKLIDLLIPELLRVCKDGSVICAFAAGGGGKAVALQFGIKLANSFRLWNELVWNKRGIGLGSNYRYKWERVFVVTNGGDKLPFYDDSKTQANVIDSRKIIPDAESHTTEKPVNLMELFIKNHSREDEIILDCFSGSGTTGVAAIQTGRRFIGFEIDPRWVDLANKRIEAAKAQGVLEL